MQATHQKIQEKDFYATQITLSAVTRGAGARGCTAGLAGARTQEGLLALPDGFAETIEPAVRRGGTVASARSAVEAHGERAAAQPQRVLDPEDKLGLGAARRVRARLALHCILLAATASERETCSLRVISPSISRASRLDCQHGWVQV